MTNITISQELARQFAVECFDAIIRDITENEDFTDEKK